MVHTPLRSRIAHESPDIAGAMNLIAFGDHQVSGNRFTTRDRCDVLAVQTETAANIRVVVHQLPASALESGSDFLLAYEQREQWASWGMARQSGRLIVWSCAAGKDLGPFSSIANAVSALSAPGRRS